MKISRLPLLLALVLAPLAPASALTPMISEFLASNREATVLSDGTTPDWIEVHNPGDSPVDLSGWHLTDDPQQPTLWTFPDGFIMPPGFYFVIYASGVSQTDPSSLLHTNFRLSSDGEYLALVKPNGEIHQEFAPDYPDQQQDVSYGFFEREPDPFYFPNPTPGAANIEPLTEDTKFSVDRGFYEDPFEVVVTSDTPGASIYYTTDGSDPTLESPKIDAPDDLTPPAATISISDTTVLRAMAAKPGYSPSDIDTQTYLFLDQVISHPEMSPTITSDPVWGPQMREALLEIPSISLVTQEEIPDQTPSIQSPREIPVSIEMIYPDGRRGFQENAGVERFGGQYTLFDKKALRISFKRIYGVPRLRHDLLGDVKYGAEGVVENFDQILLRNGSHDAIFFEGYPRPRNGALVRNRYFLDRQLEMGQHSLRGKFVHVYLNGVYYGHFHLMERPTADHMAQYFGGDEEDYDVMKGRSGISVAQGNSQAWDTLVGNARDWDTVQQYMDVDSYIDYMLLNFYGGNDHDWYPQHNWIAARKREENAGFKFFMWDSDFLMRARLPDGGNTTDNGGPGGMINNLKTIPEFRLRMADRAQKHFFGDGVLTAAKVNADYNAFGQELARTIIPETARWGDYNTPFYTPLTFQNAIQWLAEDYPNGNARPRVETVIRQMRAAGLFPDVDAPYFNQHGGTVPSGFPLAIMHDEGELYYTTDGSDPRLPDGSVNPDAVAVGGPRFPSTIIEKGSTWQFDDSGVDHQSEWLASDFNASSWTDAATPIGFGRITNTNLATAAFAGKSRQVTFYCRKTFEVEDASAIAGASMNIKADDGIRVFLNGKEVLRDLLPEGPIDINTEATDNGLEGEFVNFPLDPADFVNGTNLICVEVHNRRLDNNDMVFDLELVTEEFNPNRLVTLDQTSVVKSRVLKDSEWSALTEATFITDIPADSTNLVISEIHYNPSGDQGDDSEFIELMNTSTQSISLAGVYFSEGITFTFDEQAALAPGERVVLISDEAAFQAAYGSEVVHGGIYSARLANGGERVTLNAADGTIIESLDYGDSAPWPTIADGVGYSLVRVAPGGSGLAGSPANWRSSLDPGGTPSGSDSFPYDPSSGESLLKYASGENGSGRLIFVGDTAILEHRRIHGADDVELIVQVSSDLENWSTSGVSFLSQSNQADQSALMRWILPVPEGNQVFTRILARSTQ